VVAEDAIVRGRLTGSVRALRVMLRSQSHVEGNLFYKSLSIEQGTYFEGESRPSEAISQLGSTQGEWES
jgi:cytoskeletal protein CcmA (bactofilin family)